MEKFDSKYLSMARIWATNSHAKRSKVGALLVKDNMIISDGYNGTPKGFDNACEYRAGCEFDVDDSWDFNYSKCAKTKTDETGCLQRDIRYCSEFKECPNEILVTKPEVLHAEANAITKVAKSTNSSEGSTLYVTLSPCLECAKLIIQSGIKRVVYYEEYRDTSGLELLKKAGIEVEQIKDLD